MIQGWIWQQNLWPFVETAASFVGVTPDDYDSEAIEHGLSHTDVEQDHWFAYSFGTSLSLRLALAQDVGTEVLFVQAEAGADASVNMNVAIQIFQNYRVASDKLDTA